MASLLSFSLRPTRWFNSTVVLPPFHTPDPQTSFHNDEVAHLHDNQTIDRRSGQRIMYECCSRADHRTPRFGPCPMLCSATCDSRRNRPGVRPRRLRSPKRSISELLTVSTVHLPTARGDDASGPTGPNLAGQWFCASEMNATDVFCRLELTMLLTQTGTSIGTAQGGP